MNSCPPETTLSENLSWPIRKQAGVWIV